MIKYILFILSFIVGYMSDCFNTGYMHSTSNFGIFLFMVALMTMGISIVMFLVEYFDDKDGFYPDSD